MSSIARRAGAQIAKMLGLGADPSAEVGRNLSYAKSVLGVTQAFSRSSDGTIYQTTPNTAYRYRELNASGAALITDEILVITGYITLVTVNLPAAAACPPGQRFCIKDGDGNANLMNIVLDAAGVDTIDGDGSVTIALSYGSVDLVTNGISAWRII